MTSDKKKTTWQKTRKFINDLHLWAGLGGGLIVIVICFSGTVYTFNTELREMASPELYEVEKGERKLTAEEIIARVEKATGGQATLIRIPASDGRTWQVSVRRPEPKKKEDNPREERAQRNNINAQKGSDGKSAQRGGTESPRPSQSRGGGRPSMGTAYAVNPYTGEIVGDITNEKNRVTEFMRTMFSLHRWLMLDRLEEPIFGELPNRKLGSYISGTATLLFTFGLLTGIIIWFPQKVKSWRQGLVIKWSGKWKRLNHDLHNTLAFYAFIFLLLMGITGPQWSFEWYRNGLRKTLGTYQEPGKSPFAEQPQSVLPADSVFNKPSVTQYVQAANAVLPHDGDISITLPSDSTAAVAISKTKVGFFAPAAADRLYLDQYTVSVVKTDIFTDKPLNERIAGSIKAIHLGDVYGKFTKILYFLACLIATTLPVTGTIIWINKLNKKRKRKAKDEKRKTEADLARQAL